MIHGDPFGGRVRFYSAVSPGEDRGAANAAANWRRALLPTRIHCPHSKVHYSVEGTGA